MAYMTSPEYEGCLELEGTKKSSYWNTEVVGVMKNSFILEK